MGNIREILIPVILFAIPISAIIGGITIGIIRAIGEQRLLELAQRERIAAIERGVDPSKLTPLPSSAVYDDLTRGRRSAARAQGLMIGGLVTVAVGIGILVMLLAMEPHENHWTIGLLPIFVGAALLISARIVWPRPNGNGTAAPRPPAA